MKGDDFQANRLLLNRSFVQSIATLTGRIGFAVQPTVLLYAKAGGAWVHDLYNIGFPASAGGSFTPSPLGIFQVIAVSTGGFPPGTIVALGRNTSGGWTAGAGIEWAMFGGDWSTSIEYNYMNFGTSRVTLLATLQPNTLFPIDIAQRAHVVLFGLNYHFLGGPPRY
jgi:opacity protein-like surface antigen